MAALQANSGFLMTRDEQGNFILEFSNHRNKHRISVCVRPDSLACMEIKEIAISEDMPIIEETQNLYDALTFFVEEHKAK